MSKNSKWYKLSWDTMYNYLYLFEFRFFSTVCIGHSENVSSFWIWCVWQSIYYFFSRDRHGGCCFLSAFYHSMNYLFKIMSVTVYQSLHSISLYFKRLKQYMPHANNFNRCKQAFKICFILQSSKDVRKKRQIRLVWS